MPGYPVLADESYAASMGYAVPASYDGGVSHGAFIIWLLVYVVAATLVLGGLKVGGFSFVFRSR